MTMWQSQTRPSFLFHNLAQASNKRNTMDDTSGAGMVYPSGAPGLIVSF